MVIGTLILETNLFDYNRNVKHNFAMQNMKNIVRFISTIATTEFFHR